MIDSSGPIRISAHQVPASDRREGSGELRLPLSAAAAALLNPLPSSLPRPGSPPTGLRHLLPTFAVDG